MDFCSLKIQLSVTTIEVTTGEKIVLNGQEFPIASLPQNLMDIINAGGLVKAMRRLNGLED